MLLLAQWLRFGTGMRGSYLTVITLVLGGVWANALPQPLAEIPFEYREGLIWLRVNLPQSTEPLMFLLDSGAAVSALDRQTTERLGLRLGERVTVRGVGTQTAARWSEAVTASVGNISFRQKFLSVDFSRLSQNCERHIDGLLGADFFRGRIVQIDFAAATVRLLAAAPPAKDSSLLPLRICKGAMRVPIRVNGSDPKWVRLDTGCAKPLHWVVGDVRLGGCEKQVSVGLADVTSYMTETTVQIGSDRFEAVPTGLHAQQIFAGEAGLLGNGLLSQFRVTVDTNGGHVLLEKN